jgi:hypothetical protein
MPFYRAITAAVLLSALLANGASAFETTSIGGANADGSAKFQAPDELGAALSPSTSTATTSSPLSNFNFSAGAAPDNSNSSTTNWLNGPGSPGFGFTGSQSTSAEPASPFNTPILRERN